MRRPAFTLIELLISLAIVAVVLGASISANRALLTNAQITQEHTQMSMIANEVVSNMQLLQRQLKAAGKSLGDADQGFALAAATTTLSNQVVPWSAAASSVNDPIVLQWCPLN